MKMRNIDDDQREFTVRSARLNRKEHPNLYHRRVGWSQDLDRPMRCWRSLRKNVVDDSTYLFVDSGGDQLSPSYLPRIVK